MKVLIIEDNPDTQASLAAQLKRKGCTVDGASDGERGSYYARTNNYDLILLDCGLPKKDGVTVCEEIRHQQSEVRKHTPIIMISVQGETPDKVGGLMKGADDYITKPFSFDEVFARMQTVMRRPQIRETGVVTIGNLMIDLGAQRIERGGEPVRLTRKEFALLEYLTRHRGEPVSRHDIFENVWGMDSDPFSHTVEVHILNLRRKIDTGREMKLIHNIHGRGYLLGILE